MERSDRTDAPTDAPGASPATAARRPGRGTLAAARRLAVGAVVAGMTGLSLASLVWNPFQGQSARLVPPREMPGNRCVELLSKDATTRRVRDAVGVCDVPLHPKRIVALAYTDELVALGLKPCAMASGRSWGLFEDYLGDRIDGVVRLPYGHFYDVLPCYDAIADCRPDLIVVRGTDEHTCRQLSTIAPTLALRVGYGTIHAKDTSRGTALLHELKGRLRDLGAALGRDAEADAAIAHFDRKLEDARRVLGPVLRGKTVACFRTRWGRWLLYGPQSQLVGGPEAIFEALGVQAPAIGQGLARDLELEELLEFDADYIIMGADDTVGAPQALERIRQNALWKRSRAVADGHVYEIHECNHWLTGGLLAQERILDDLAHCAGVTLPGDAP